MEQENENQMSVAVLGVIITLTNIPKFAPDSLSVHG